MKNGKKKEDLANYLVLMDKAKSLINEASTLLHDHDTDPLVKNVWSNNLILWKNVYQHIGSTQKTFDKITK